MKTTRGETFMTSYPFTRIFCLLLFLEKLVQLVPLLNLHLCFGIFSPYSFSPSLQHHLLSLLYFVNLKNSHNVEIESLSQFSRVWLFATPWTMAHQASLSITNCQSTQTHVHWVGDAIQPSHPITPFSYCPQSFPAPGSFQTSQLSESGGQSIGVSASACPSNEHPGLL